MNAGGQVLPFKTYTSKDGLLNQKVDAIIRDDKGLLWVGTPFGVNWFDGDHFYEPVIPAKTGQLYITNFFKDKKGTIWVLTFYNGIYEFKNNTFTNFLPDTTLLESNANSVFGMLQFNDSLYLVATDRNLYWFNGKVFWLFDKNNPLLNIQITAIGLLQNGTLLLGNSKGLYRYTYNKQTWEYKGMILQDYEVNDIFPEKDLVWIATTKGLLRYSNIETFSQTPEKVHPIAVSDINKNLEGNIWFTSEKLYKIQNNTFHQYDLENGLPDYAQKIYFDQEGILWIGSAKGLTKLTNESYVFDDLRKGPIHSMITALAKDKTGKLWLGNYMGIATKTREGYRMLTNNSKNIGYVSWLYNTSSNKLLAGTINGIFHIDQNKPIKKYNLISTKVFEDETGTLWLGTEDGSVFNIKNDELKKIRLKTHIREYIDAIFKDQYGFLWIGYRASGLWKFQINNQEASFVKEYSARTGFIDLRIRSSNTDKKGNIIFGTRTNGIFIFSMVDSSKFWHLNTSDGLSGNWVKSIGISNNNNIYLATNKGVDVMMGDYQSPNFQKLDLLEDALQGGAAVVFPDTAAVWIGTDAGLLEYFPGKDKKNSVPPNVYLTQLTINGRPDSSVSPYTVNNSKTLNLPYNQNIIAFEFAGINLKDEKALRFRYMLEGQKGEWTMVTERNFVTYNLQPGSYNFKVEAEGNNGIWSKTPASFKFIIHPPFWKTAWFITLCTLLVITLFYFLYQYRLKQVLKVEKLRSRISSDLHDDIGSTLSSISILSDIALQEPDRQQSKQMVSEIKDNSLMLMEKMDDIVWSINPKNDSLENLMLRIKRFAGRLFEAKEIDYTINIDEAIKHVRLSMEHRQHIYLILKEAINNLVKYSTATEASIIVKYEDDLLKITIYDNGIGFNRENVFTGNGLLNMEHRASVMKAGLSISSGAGVGTRIILKTKIK